MKLKSVFLRCFLVILCLYFLSCSDAGIGIDALKNAPDNLVQRAEDVEILYSDSAQLLVKISGPLLLDYVDKSNPRTEFPDGVKVDFYNENEVVQSTLTSKYAMRYTKEDRTVARDSVVLKTIEGEMLETEELIWDERSGRIYSNKFCIIHKADEIIQGYGFESNEDFSESRIKKVTGRIKVEKPNI